MLRLLSFPHRSVTFSQQVTAVQSLFAECALTTESANTTIPRILSYPGDVIHYSIQRSPTLRLRRLFLSSKEFLTFDSDYAGIKLAIYRPEDVNAWVISNPAFLEFLSRFHNAKFLKQSAIQRVPTMTLGECVRLLHHYPEKSIEDFILTKPESLSNTLEFSALCSLQNTRLNALIPKLYKKLIEERESLDCNYLLRAGRFLQKYEEVKEDIVTFAVKNAEMLSPEAMNLLCNDLKKPGKYAKERVKNAVECNEISWFATEDLLGVVEWIVRHRISISPEFKSRLITDLIPHLSSPLQSINTKSAFLLHSLKHDESEDIEPSLLPHQPRNDTSPLATFLRTASESELSEWLQTASSEELVRVVRMVQYKAVEKEGILHGVERRLGMVMTEDMDIKDGLKYCEILSRLIAMNRNPRGLVEKLARIVQKKTDWIDNNTVVAFAHLFSYASFNHAITNMICELLQATHSPAKTSDTLPKDTYYYQSDSQYHIPQNQILNTLPPTQVAILIICLQRSRKLDSKAQEIIHQYIKCLLPCFDQLIVKHRSSLLLGTSYRENFDVSLWNELVQAVHKYEDCKFDTPLTRRSLTVYYTAATNVRNLLRNIPLNRLQPSELVLNGEKLADFSPKNNPRIARFS